jgi:type II secretory pathway component PulF
MKWTEKQMLTMLLNAGTELRDAQKLHAQEHDRKKKIELFKEIRKAETVLDNTIENIKEAMG